MDKYIIVCNDYGIVGSGSTPEKALKEAADTVGKEYLQKYFEEDDAKLLEVAKELQVVYKAEIVQQPVVKKETKNASRR